MFQITSKVIVLGFVCVISVTALIVVIAQAVRPDELPGLRAGTWTAVGQVESLPTPSPAQTGDARLGDLQSFEVAASEQPGPVVHLTLHYRDGSIVTTNASNEMQPGCLQLTLVNATGVRTFVSFKQKSSSQPVEVTDGRSVARFAF